MVENVVVRVLALVGGLLGGAGLNKRQPRAESNAESATGLGAHG